ncbi:MAG: YbaB/EbfC family nucleoid-associated protein [Planctomycetota bacterium]
MFDNMKAMGAIAGLLRNKERLREIGEEFQQRIERVSVIGSAGSGAVRVTMNGKLRVEEVQLDPSLIAGLGAGGEGGREMAESLLAEAYNAAQVQAQAMIREEARRLAEEYDLPDLPGMDSLLGGGGGLPGA